MAAAHDDFIKYYIVYVVYRVSMYVVGHGDTTRRSNLTP